MTGDQVEFKTLHQHRLSELLLEYAKVHDLDGYRFELFLSLARLAIADLEAGMRVLGDERL